MISDWRGVMIEKWWKMSRRMYLVDLDRWVKCRSSVWNFDVTPVVGWLNNPVDAWPKTVCIYGYLFRNKESGDLYFTEVDFRSAMMDTWTEDQYTFRLWKSYLFKLLTKKISDAKHEKVLISFDFCFGSVCKSFMIMMPEWKERIFKRFDINHAPKKARIWTICIMQKYWTKHRMENFGFVSQICKPNT